SIFILLVAALMRLYALELNPLHHDEGVNGFFLIKLINQGEYQYDPANYHGPTLYYFALLSAKLFKLAGVSLNTYAIRIVPVAFGVLTVWLILCLRRRLGAMGALTGAALVALSPGAVYMSRYFIHESLFVFFTLGIVVAWLKYYDESPPEEYREGLGLIVVACAVVLVLSALGAVYQPSYHRLKLILLINSFIALLTMLWLYDGARATYLILAAISAALLFATKETAVISAGVLLIAVVSATVYMNIRRPVVVESKKKKKQQQWRQSKARRGGGRWRQSLERFGGPAHIALLSLAALALFATVAVIFYSSFFTNAKGVSDAFETFNIWTKTGMKDHTSPWHEFRYAKWLAAEESPLVFLGGAGILVALWRASSRVVVALALWALGIVAAYSLIPYKTPWLMLSFIAPLAIIGGYAVETFYQLSRDTFERLLVPVIAIASLALAATQTVKLNFIHYDDEQYVYVYAHTVRGFLPLVNDINQLAERAGTGALTGITVTSRDYWPLPWYLRDYQKVGYFGQLTRPIEPLIICSEQQETELKNLYGIEDDYRRINSYPLRPGVTLVLYARRNLPDGAPRPAGQTTIDGRVQNEQK
ncbi:MAG TPA: glycosyltransferase family 39 protein, partial [Pyrinomonadaceae bacterium]